MTSYLIIHKDVHLTKAYQKEKHDTASQLLLKEYANRNWSRRCKPLSEKLLNSVLFGSGRRPT